MANIGISIRIIIICIAVVVLFMGVVLIASIAGFGVSVAVVIGGCLGVTIALLGSKWAVRPLSRAVESVSEYELTQNPDAFLAVEGGELAALMNATSQVVAVASDGRLFAENALKAMCNPLLVTDISGKVVLATQALLDLVEKPLTQIIGFSDCQVLFNKVSGSIALEVIKNGETCLDRQEEFDMANGSKLDLRIFASRIVNAEGDSIGAVLSILNVHTLVEQQREMDKQREQIVAVGKEVSVLAERVASASEELSASADELASGAKLQKGQTDTVATAMEEMTSTVLEVARNASATSLAAGESDQAATQGMDMVSQAVAAIHGVSDSANKLAEVVQQLDEQSAQIGKVISVINDIADQTNLLALNAAIEAARAGEAGRGFAVVADEVRKLAEKTMIATKEVEAAIKTIQDRSKMAMGSMEETGKRVDNTTELANEAGKSLQFITESIQDVVSQATQIATAAEQQSAAAEEINQAVESIAQVASEADEGAGQTAAATRDLAELSQQLLAVSMQFTGKEKDFSRLRESEGEMKGVLPKLMQEFIQNEFGDGVYQAMQEEMGEPVFLPTNSYPEKVFIQMAELVAEAEDIPVEEIFLKVGRFTMRRFTELYPSYIKNDNLKDFYLRMNDLHAKLTEAHPGIKPPNFTYEDKGDVLFMNYRSKRGLFHYFEGILTGAAEFKGEPVSIEVKPLDAETARAEIHFL